MNAVHIEDLGALPRAGCKGPQAAAWLQGLGLTLPERPNSALVDADGVVARLGWTEFLVEGEAAARVAAAPRVHGVYPVLRQDVAFALSGPGLRQLLLQCCNVDFDIQADDAVVLTSMAGVAVTVLPAHSGSPCRIWCDGTMGHYLRETLDGIAAEQAACPSH